MTWALPEAYDYPGAPTGAQWTFQIGFKTFEENTTALLQTALNNWALTTGAAVQEFCILSVNYQSGAKEKALITYGYFVDLIP